jgi:hypothetical protein
MAVLNNLRMHARFVRELPGFLRYRVTLEESRDLLRRGVRDRVPNFLRVLKHGIYRHEASPYLPLLKRAGCELGDLEASVRRLGLEATLEALRAEGVYFTFEEFKGRAPVVRGGAEISVRAGDFDNPYLACAYETETGGSSGGVGTRVAVDLETVKAQIPHLMMTRAVHDMLDRPSAIWRGALPDPTGTGIILRAIGYGGVPQRWFTPTKPAYGKGLKNRLATATILGMSRLHGIRVPFPEFVPINRAGVIARWATEAVRTHGSCTVGTTMSLAVRICLASERDGLDLSGVRFMGGSEPFTPARARVIERTGARLVPHYIGVDVGPMGFACARPSSVDDVHLLRDCVAVIQHPRKMLGSDASVDAFYVTSLRPTAAKILLNVETDDYGILEQRSCGCAFEGLGYTEHLREIRSFGKLTGEGVTLVGSEMIRVLEEVLPARFGGSPLDFQLLEEEDENGLSRLNLIVSPRLSIAREEAVAETVLHALRRAGAAADIARAFWQQAGTLRVTRAEPVWTARGKLLPIRVAGNFARARAEGPEAVSRTSGEAGAGPVR